MKLKDINWFNFGVFITTYPKHIIVLTLLLFSTCIPALILLDMTAVEPPEVSFLSIGSETDIELDLLRDHWQYPFRSGILMIKPITTNTNVLQYKYIKILYELEFELKKITTTNGYTFHDLCHFNINRECQVLSITEFWSTLSELMIDSNIINTINDKCEPKYDRTRRFIAGIQYNGTFATIKSATHLISVFKLNSTLALRNEVDEFEYLYMKTVDSLASKYSSLVKVYRSSYRAPTDEMNRSSQLSNTKIIPFVVLQYFMMWVYLCISISKDRKNPRISVSLIGIVLGCMSYFWSIAYCYYCGISATSGVLIGLFSILAISVDDVFVFVHAFDTSDNTFPLNLRIADSIAEIGSSISVTSLTTSISLIVGSIASTRAFIREFALVLGLAFFIDFILQLVVFPIAFMLLEVENNNKTSFKRRSSSNRLNSFSTSDVHNLSDDKIADKSTSIVLSTFNNESENNSSQQCLSPSTSPTLTSIKMEYGKKEMKKENRFTHFLIDHIIPILINYRCAMVMIFFILPAILIYVGSVLPTGRLGTTQTNFFVPSEQTSFDSEVKSLNDGFKDVEIYLKPNLDYSQPQVRSEMIELERMLQHHPKLRPPILSWHRDYQQWLEMMVYYQYKSFLPTTKQQYEKSLKEFLNTTGSLYADDILFCDDGVSICASRIRVFRRNIISNDDDELNDLHSLRWSVASAGNNLEPHVFSFALLGAAVADGIFEELFAVTLFSFLSVSIAFYLFSRNLVITLVLCFVVFTSLATTIAIIMLFLPISVLSELAMIMAIAISMDIGSHIALHTVHSFQITATQRVEEALITYLEPSLQATVSTLLGTTVLSFSESPVLHNFWISFTFSCIFAFIYGVIVLPYILISITTTFKYENVNQNLKHIKKLLVVQLKKILWQIEKLFWSTPWCRLIMWIISILLCLELGLMATTNNFIIPNLQVGPTKLRKVDSAPIIESSRTVKHETFDFIVVGTGTAGSMMASKLAEERDFQILALDKGPKLTDTSLDGAMFLKPTAPIFEFWGTSPHDNRFFSIPQAAVSFRKLSNPRFEGFGGTSQLNGGLANRPSKEFLNSMFPENWKYNDLLPYYKMIEDHFCYYDNNTLISESECKKYHGKGGPMEVNSVIQEHLLEWVKLNHSNSIWNACDEMNFTRNNDYMGEHHEGCSFWQFFRSRVELDHDFLAANECEVRRKTRKIYNKPLARADTFSMNILKDSARSIRHGNLQVRDEAKVTKILFDGKRAIGVVYFKNNQQVIAYAKREVILSSGVFGTPVLLQVSGIGAQTDLRHLSNVEHIVENPYVGHNMRDHISLSLEYYTKNITFPLTNPQTFESTVKEKPGYFQVNGNYVFNIHGKSKIKYDFEDWQVYILEGIPTQHSFSVISTVGLGQYGIRDRYNLMDIGNGRHVLPLFYDTKNPIASFLISHKFPQTRGYVIASTSDVDSIPIIDNGFQNFTDYDIGVLKHAMKKVRTMVTNTTWGKTYFINERFPDSSITDEEHIRMHSSSTFQNTGTCEMNKCTTNDLRVRGTSNLRVCDSSVLLGANANVQGTILAVCMKFITELIQEHRTKKVCDIFNHNCYDHPAPMEPTKTISGIYENLVSQRPLINMWVCFTTNVSLLHIPLNIINWDSNVCTQTNWRGEFVLTNLPSDEEIIIFNYHPEVATTNWMGSTKVPQYNLLPSIQPTTIKQINQLLALLNVMYNTSIYGGVSYYAINNVVATPTIHKLEIVKGVQFTIHNVNYNNRNRTLIWQDDTNKLKAGTPPPGNSNIGVIELNILPGRYQVSATHNGKACVPTLDSHLTNDPYRAWVSIWKNSLADNDDSLLHYAVDYITLQNIFFVSRPAPCKAKFIVYNEKI